MRGRFIHPMTRIRPLLLPLAGLTLVFALWGCAGSSGGKTAGARGPKVWRPSTPDAAGPTLARVGGRRITRLDVDSILATAPASIKDEYLQDPEQYKLLVERIAQQEAIYLAARRDGIDHDSLYLADVAIQQRQLLMKRYYQKTVAALPHMSDDEVRQYYDAHPSEFSMPARVRVRHIQVPTLAKAREVSRQLHSSSWDNVCARFSTDKVTAKTGGLIGFVTSADDQVPGVGKAPAIVAAAFKLKEGESSAPLKSERAWHIIRVDEKVETGPQPFANVKQEIRGHLEGSRSEHFQETLIDSLKKVYGVVVYGDSIEVAMKPVLTPAELFAKAQAVPSPQERIELFQQVVSRYPNDKSAVQAAFMVGFTYAEELSDYPKARAAFQDFLRKYPKSDLVVSANWMLDNMEHSAPPPEVGLPDSLKIETKPSGGPKGTNSKP